MPKAPPTYRPRAQRQRASQPGAPRNRAHDVKRYAAKPWRNWYKLKIWKDLRSRQLHAQPYCQRCARRGALDVVATIVNHIAPHRGVWRLFADAGNLESLCKPCHDGPVQSFERLGYSKEVDETGRYLDPRHPSNQWPPAPMMPPPS